MVSEEINWGDPDPGLRLEGHRCFVLLVLFAYAAAVTTRYACDRSQPEDTMDATCESSGVQKVDSRTIVLFLHGSGDSGPNFRATLSSFAPIESLVPDNAIVLFPTAPKRPYTAANSAEMNVWFDRTRLHYDETEDPGSLAQSIMFLNSILSEAVARAGNNPKIVFVGFSMGGSMALHLAFHRLEHGLTTHGVLVLSSFVGRFSTVIPRVSDGQGARTLIPVLNRVTMQMKMVHGTADEMVPVSWGTLTAYRLRENGFLVDCSKINGLAHHISHSTVGEIAMFVRSVCRIE